ncbi:MAG: hypothetical protein HKN13_10170 [Rhodothermales bacterium]|nr:hypothetical protein [Rhodothermales bacterium]
MSSQSNTLFFSLPMIDPGSTNRMLQQFVRVVLFIGFAFQITSCDSAVEPESVDFSTIRLEAGISYTYTSRLVVTAKDLSGVVLSSDTAVDTVVVEILPVPETVDQVDISFQFDVYNPKRTDLRATTWYFQSDTSLTEVAYRNLATVVFATPKRDRPLASRRVRSFPLSGFLLQSEALVGNPDDPDSVIVRPSPRVVYASPLAVGQKWVSFTDPFMQEREVIREERISVGAGTYDTVVIESVSGAPFDGTRYLDFVATVGLVRRVSTSSSELKDAGNTTIGTLESELAVEVVAIERD